MGVQVGTSFELRRSSSLARVRRNRAPTNYPRLAGVRRVEAGKDASVKAAADQGADYDQLYRTHHARVLRLCQLLLSDPHEAEEVAQEVFLKLFRAHPGDGQVLSWGSWLTKVAINACRDRRRSGWWKWWRERHVEFVETGFSTDLPTPEEAAVSNERRREIWNSFRELSTRQQEVFVLRYVEGWSTEDVAATLGLSTGSIKRHLYRAVHHLRTALRGRQ
jgi:RNA polymerase sigma-70 factor (ECF subfamily)